MEVAIADALDPLRRNTSDLAGLETRPQIRKRPNVDVIERIVEVVDIELRLDI